VAKVKKGTAVTGVRNVKASKKPTTKRRASPPRAARPAAGRTSSRTKVSAIPKAKAKSKPVSKVRSISKARSFSKAKSKAKPAPPAPVVRVVVKPLEPQEKCGTGTSVQLLFRVDETVNGRSTKHLVFFDRHGWYCEHGRNCPAVGHAKKHKGHIARAS
jgi:hypothetical protein